MAVITGGAGFIGFHLSKFLLNRSIDVKIFDNFSNYYSEKIKRQNARELIDLGAEVIEGDILKKNDLYKIFTCDIDYLFHLAAQPGVRYSTINPEKALRINVEGTANVISVARENNIKRLVIASSSSVFGNRKYLPIDEKHPKNPISYYGASKLAAEKIVDVTTHLFDDIEINIIRPFTVVGARQRPDMGLHIFISKILKGEKIIVYGDGNQTRDWTHVENIVSAFYLAATKEVKNEDFNIGSSKRTSINELLDILTEFTNKKINIIRKDLDRADVVDTLANITKAKQLLGYKPKKTLINAIEDFIADYNNIKDLL